jgi:DNA adenine methylase
MPVSYIGGKSKIGKWIRNYIPNDIETYVECFGGMYWTFFCLELPKFKNLKTVVYNDFNPLNVNVFNCLRNHKEFLKVINTYQSQDKELFNKFQKELFDPNFKLDLSEPDYHSASKYLYLLTQVWSGTNPERSKFIDLKGKYKSKFDSFKDKLKNPKWQALFEKITVVENLDFEDVIKKYDSSNTYFYCDPPYYKTENYYANHEFGLSTHERLANCLKSTQGKFSLSYYYFDNLSEWFPEDKFTWTNRQFAKAAMATAGKTQNKATELLIMNY